jgi:hypothetical protein
MGKVLMEITMSLDGYTAGPDVSAEEPLVRRRTSGPAAGTDPGDQQPTRHAPDLPGRCSCHPSVAGEIEPEDGIKGAMAQE